MQKYFFFLAVLLCGNALAAQSPNFNQGWESVNVGQTNLPYFYEQNCAEDPCDRCDVLPLRVVNTRSRAGTRAIEMRRRYRDAALTGGSYCSYRNEIANWNDAFAGYNDHVWFGFSVYISSNYLGDRWSADNVHIFQFKNVDAGGGGNQYGSIITTNHNGKNVIKVEGLGIVADTKLNSWMDIQLHLYYNTNGGGAIEVWVDDVYKSKFNVDFPAKQNCYPKFGTYSDQMASSDPTHLVFYDEIKWYKAYNWNNYRRVVRPNGVSTRHTNVLKGRWVNAPGSQSSNPGHRLVDGFNGNNRRWSAYGYSKTATINLGQTYTLKSAELFPYQRRQYKYVIQTSMDNVNWHTVVNRHGWYAETGAVRDNFSSREARYVRLRVDGAHGYSGNWVSINELRIYGRPGTKSATGDQTEKEYILDDVDLPPPAIEWEDELAFLVSPNPSSLGESLSVVTNATLREEAEVDVFTVDGRLLKTHRLGAGTDRHALVSDFPVAGVYLLRLRSGERAVTRRVVVR